MSTPFRISIFIFLLILCAVALEMLRSAREDQLQEIAKRKFAVHLTVEQQKDSTLNKKLERMVTACPGLQEYSPDFSRAEVVEHIGTYYFEGDDGGVQVRFKVSDNPQYLPQELGKSQGNTCYISINGAGTEMSISKSACKSLCQGKWVEHAGGVDMKVAM